MINSQGEDMDLADTYPREGSREQITQRPAPQVLKRSERSSNPNPNLTLTLQVREMKHGTTKGTNHPPGYMGFIPAPQVPPMQH